MVDRKEALGVKAGCQRVPEEQPGSKKVEAPSVGNPSQSWQQKGGKKLGAGLRSRIEKGFLFLFLLFWGIEKT